MRARRSQPRCASPARRALQRFRSSRSSRARACRISRIAPTRASTRASSEAGPPSRPRRSYRLRFGGALPEAKTTFLTHENALVELIEDKSVDVVAIVAGQPAKLLADMKPEAKQFIKLLKLDPAQASTRAALQAYFPATIGAASYPNILG